MDRNSIINELLITEKKIGKLITRFNDRQENIAHIDLDLTLEHIRKLYDLVLQLETEDPVVEDVKQEEKVIPEKIEKESRIEEEDVIQNQDVEESVIAKEKDSKEAAETKEREAESVEIKEQIPPSTSDLFENETVADQKPKVDKKSKKDESVPAGVTMDLFGETVADKVAPGNDKTIADTISETIKEESISDVINKSAIDDLKAAIGINEKFFFINELFDGNMKDYNEAIDKLNGFENKNDAFTYLDEVKIKYQWKEENEAVSQLTELITRKYSG